MELKPLRERIGHAEWRRLVDDMKRANQRREAERAAERDQRRLDRLIAQQHNEEHPGGCERCGEKYGPGDNGPAEIVLADGRHIVVHAVCIDGEELA